MSIQFEAIESSIIRFRHHDAETSVMTIVFKNTKTGDPTSVYSYENISESVYREGCAQESFGSWFQRSINKFPAMFPFTRLADSYAEFAERNGDSQSDLDFASQEPVPAKIVEPELILPSDPEALKATAAEKVKEALSLGFVRPMAACVDPATVQIHIATIEDRSRAERFVLAFAAMQKGANSVFDPIIAEKFKAHKEAVADKKLCIGQVALLESRFKQAIGQFDLAAEKARRAEEERIRAEQAKEAEEEAVARALEMQLQDAVSAEENGDKELAEQIIASAPLPVAPVYQAPVFVPSVVPTTSSVKTRMEWDYEIVNEDEIQRQYMMPNDKAIGDQVKNLGPKCGISGIRVFEKPVTGRTSRKSA